MYLQLDTKFNPFTYDEMMKPLLYYKQAYDEAEAAYSDLAAQTEAWKDIANREKSPEAFEMYQRYSGDLEKAVNDFSQGMNSRNRGALLGLKRRYASDIQPIANAYKRKLELADEQRKAELSNPTMLWERKASDMSLDDFINDPSADYGRGISGAVLSAQVAAGASALAKELRNNPESMIELVGKDYYEYIKERGFSSEAILDAIKNNSNASPVLTQLVEDTINSSGIKGWADANTLDQAYAYARQGLWNAVGQSDSQLVQNWRAQENLSHQHAMARQDDAQAFQADEAKKNRDFQREQLAPREIIGKDGKGTGTYYDPKLNMITDKDGNVITGDKEGVLKVGTTSGGMTPEQKAAEKLSKDFSTVNSVNSMKDLGYTPIAVTGKFNGEWVGLKDGEDVPGVWSDFTRSNLVTNHYVPIGIDGNVTFKPRRKGAEAGGVTYVKPGPNNTWPSIPKEAQESIANQLNELKLKDYQDVQLLRVRAERGEGISGEDYDYIICVSND